MVYQELISSYENKGLDITSLKGMLEIAKPLKGRPKYRAIDIIAQRSALLNDINNLLIEYEKPDRLDVFENDINNILNTYFLILVHSIKSAKAWKFIEVDELEYTIENFKKLSKKEQFKKIYLLNEKYLEFLGYQNIADIRDCLDNANDLNDETIEKVEFLRQMFCGLRNREAKIEFFCFDKAFLIALIDFRNSKSFKLEDYMKTKRKKSRKEYKKFLQFFTNEDFRDIAENLDLAKKTLKVPANTIIEAYSELSESEAEVYYIEEEFKGFKKLEEKDKKMQAVRKEFEKEKAKLEKERKEREKLEEKIRKEEEKRLEEEEKKKALQNIAEAIIVTRNKDTDKEKDSNETIENKKNKKESKTKKTEKTEKVKKIKKEENFEKEIIEENYTKQKEQVTPLIFSWLEREHITLSKKVGTQKLTQFFEKIKEIEERTGIRVSLYIVSNASKDVTLKRLKDFRKKSIQNGLPNLIEGALGEYSSFRINSDNTITDIVKMSDSKKEEILSLLENAEGITIEKELIDLSVESYIRLDYTNRNEGSITKKYLNSIINKLNKNENIANLNLKFLAFIEGKASGIDVLLEEQLKGISQISEYYKEKYSIAPGKIMNTKIDSIDDFINKEMLN